MPTVNELDPSVRDAFKKKKCPYCGGDLNPEAHPPLTIKWICDGCGRSEFLGPMDSRQFGEAFMNAKKDDG